jgi:hypothetical protein
MYTCNLLLDATALPVILFTAIGTPFTCRHKHVRHERGRQRYPAHQPIVRLPLIRKAVNGSLPLRFRYAVEAVIF